MIVSPDATFPRQNAKVDAIGMRSAVTLWAHRGVRCDLVARLQRHAIDGGRPVRTLVAVIDRDDDLRCAVDHSFELDAPQAGAHAAQ